MMGRFNAAVGRAVAALRGGHESAAPFAATRRRLVSVNLLVVSTILILMAGAIYASDDHAIDQQIDQELRSHVAHASISALITNDASGRDSDPLDPAEQYEPSSPNVFTLELDTHGHILFDPGNTVAVGLPDRGSIATVLAGQSAGLLTTYGHSPHQFRLYTIPLQQNGHIAGAIQVGMSLAARSRQLADLSFTLLIVGIAMLLLTGFASLILADLALGPVRLAYNRQRQFAAAASHELRTPLALVGSQADLIARHVRRADLTADADIADDVEEIRTEVAYMTRLVRDLLLLARDPHDPRVLLHHDVDLAAIASEVIAKLMPLAAAQQLTLITAAMPKSPMLVSGDADRLRQVVVIVLENAIRYTPEQGTVTVSVSVSMGSRLLTRSGGHVVLEVKDTGGGIAKEDLPRIFEPFYRADATRTNSAHSAGAGLGLALARWIVEAHAGTISALSTPGAGSTFTITLPLAPARASDAIA